MDADHESVIFASPFEVTFKPDGAVGAIVSEYFIVSFAHIETDPPFTLNSAQPFKPIVILSARFEVTSHHVSPACFVPTYINFDPPGPSLTIVAKPDPGCATSPSRLQPMISQ